MWRLRLNGRTKRRNPRVADESVFGVADGDGGGGGGGDENNQRPASRLLELVLALISVPLAALSCLACRSSGDHDHVGFADDMHSFGVNDLVLRDSMRYAIYV